MLLLATGCVTTVPDATPYVDEPRVLAVAASPAEVEEGETVTLTALYADGTGTLSEGALDWAFCTALHPLAELGPVADACLEPGSDDLVALGTGLEVAGAVPDDACSRFGPNPPPSEDGTTTGRPVDPDATGGFYQPAVVFDGDVPTLAPVRVRCGLANVTQETYVAWNSGYISNVAPVPTLAGPSTVTPGEEVTLTASWPDCDEACEGAETYVVWDEATDTLIERREALSATWFATDGSFGLARNGRSGDDDDTTVTNTWTAGEASATLWVVLRDERGGVGFTSLDVTVEGAR